MSGDNAGWVCKVHSRFGAIGCVMPSSNGPFRFFTQPIGKRAGQKPAVAGNLNAWRVYERPLASETQAVDDRLLQSMLGQRQDGNDVPTVSPMVFWVATRVWVEHAEAEQEIQSAHCTHGCTLGGRMA